MSNTRENRAWIIAPRIDLAWFVGGAFSSIALLAVLLVSDHPEWVWFAWVMLLDTPHYFGTYLRTYFDPAESQRRRRLWRASLLLLALGPGVIGVSAILWKSGVPAWKRPFEWFVLAFNVWAYWHLVRQHVGITALYRRRAQERGTRKIDELFLYTVLGGAFLLLINGHPESRDALQLDAHPLFSHAVSVVTVLAMIAATIAFAASQLRARASTPKLLFMLSVVGSYVFLCTFRPSYRLPLYIWSGTITIAHDLQYFALAWFHHRNRRRHVQGSGLFALVGHHWALYGACAILCGVILRSIGSALDLFPGFPPVLIHSGARTLVGSLTLRDLLFSVMLGIAMHHYFLDQIIWRPSRDPELARDLAL